MWMPETVSNKKICVYGVSADQVPMSAIRVLNLLSSIFCGSKLWSPGLHWMEIFPLLKPSIILSLHALAE